MAREKILELEPDVLTLDIEMPRMDGITFLKILQKHHPMPVVIISSIAQKQSQAALQALEAGAVDVLAKPTSAFSIGNLADELPRRIKGAAMARRSSLYSQQEVAPAVLPPASTHYDPRQLIVMGSSTGGVEALGAVLSRLPDQLPGICLVQHIPPVFSRIMAERLTAQCQFEVREAKDGDEVRRGLALVAPGDYHMSVQWRQNHYRVALSQTPPVNFTRPAVDVLFESAARCAGRHALGVILTGMGRDGAEGMRKLKVAGGTTIAQNEETCVVYGMPRAAVELGVVDQQVALNRIPDAMLQAIKPGAAHAARKLAATV
jgi:two-component system chemotaxis response regulator CheB